MPVKTNKVFNSAMVNYSSNLVLNLKQSSTSTFKPRNIHSDIPESKYWILYISVFDFKYILNYLLEYYLISNSKV